MVNFYNNVSIIYMPNIPGGQRRLIFSGNVRTNLFNTYTPGSGVGALNISARRALKRKAALSPGKLDSNGKLISSERNYCCNNT